MAHDWAIARLAGGAGFMTSEIVEDSWKYADLMQAEADKREKEESEKKRADIREMLNAPNTFVEREGQHFDDVEWQPDWSQAPEWANWWAIGSLTGQGVWSETKPVCVKFNGVNYWEVGSPAGEEHLSVAPSFNYQGNWQDSLRKRPQ